MSSARLVRHSVAERWSQQIGRAGNEGWRPEREERQVRHESRERQAAAHPVETGLPIGADGWSPAGGAGRHRIVLGGEWTRTPGQRASSNVRNVLAQLLEPPYTDPYVRWCGRGGAARLPPIPILGTFETSADVRYSAAFGGWADITRESRKRREWPIAVLCIQAADTSGTTVRRSSIHARIRWGEATRSHCRSG